MNEKFADALPHGWVWAPVGDIADVVGGGTPRRDHPEYYDGGTILWATPTDIDGKRILPISNTTTRITKLGLERSAARLLPPGTVLFSSRASIGKIAIAAKPIATNQGFANVIPHYGMDSYYLAYCLKWFANEIRDLASGTTYLEVAKSELRRFKVPIAPWQEQRRIAAQLQALFAQVWRAKQALEKVRPLLKRFRQAVLAAAFHGELTEQDPSEESAEKLLQRVSEEKQLRRLPSIWRAGDASAIGPYPLPSGWRWTHVGELETFIGSGITPLGGRKVYVSEGIPFIRSQNVHREGLRLEDVVHITRKVHEMMGRTQVRPGDVMLNITGASIGRSTYVPEGFGEANVNQHVCIIRTGWWTLPPFLSHFLNSPVGQEQIFASEAGVTREGLNYSQIRSLLVPLAPLPEQRRVVDRIEELLRSAASVERAIHVAAARCDAIGQAVLAKAFRGELVPQDPTDEPATVVLQRIRAQRPVPSAARPSGRRPARPSARTSALQVS